MSGDQLRLAMLQSLRALVLAAGSCYIVSSLLVRLFNILADVVHACPVAHRFFPACRCASCCCCTCRTCNELNAGYAADGFCRRRGVGACVVTYGVGGLSAINACAGCYSEDLPVIFISGVWGV
jgi:hypothetical protein